MFHKILIANRGEIACRVIRTAQRMGIQCVAVYSDADRHARFVEMADEAWCLGGSTPAESYLRGDKIIEIALITGSEAIHPGYGFLSENAEFAEACARNKLIFIGPPVAAIELMGSKSTAKFLMEEAQVPLVPGYHGAAQDDTTLTAKAEEIGYPLLIKASAGGGGKGMRIVREAGELLDALASARRESRSAFGNDKLLIEKFVVKPRHVEIQVFCDQHGNGVYLFERDCSIQRRHQKVAEEAPAPAFSERTRKAMGEAALNCARAIQYVGAGTVEFLLDNKDRFYFMEMNTRLQVEHPVTEMITGQDLVDWQLRVAAGEPLPCSQDSLQIRGHAFEARIYAEEPEHDFLPSAGRIAFLHTPPETRHVRLDTGVQVGDDIGVYYDPMIAKLIVWDEDRTRALARMRSALRDFAIGGVKTNISFLHRLFQHQSFAQADISTHFIEQHQAELLSPEMETPEAVPLIAAFAWLEQQNRSRSPLDRDSYSPWNSHDNWRMGGNNFQALELLYKDQPILFKVATVQGGYRISTGGGLVGNEKAAPTQFELRGQLENGILSVDLGSSIQRAKVFINNHLITIFKDGSNYVFRVPTTEFAQHDHTAGAGQTAPMNGRVIAIQVTPGQSVRKGDTLVIVEAMKMEHTVRASADGLVEELFCREGDLVQAEQQLVSFKSLSPVDKESTHEQPE